MKRPSDLLILACLLISIATLNNCKKEEDKNLPSLITVPASGITTNTAILGGIIGDNGGAEIKSRGVCWGTEPNAAVSSTMKNVMGKSTGIFTCILTGLIPNTLYYATAYATNSEGTAFGGEVKFKTNPAEPATVVTISAEDISYYEASIGFAITNDGGSDIFEKGICWATLENPTVTENDKMICTQTRPDHIGYYWASAEPLRPKTKYHVRAYADNGIGISYGNDLTFTTLPAPEVTTYTPTEITDSTAKVGGKVTSIGDVMDDIEVGICFGMYKDPTINGFHIKSNSTGYGEFICNLRNLTPGTFYYARAYVNWGYWEFFGEIFEGYTEYGNEVTFTTKP